MLTIISPWYVISNQYLVILECSTLLLNSIRMLDFELGQPEQQHLSLPQHTQNSVSPSLYITSLFVLSSLFIEYINLLILNRVITVFGWFPFSIVLCSVSWKTARQFLTERIWNFLYLMKSLTSWTFYV